MSDKDWFELCGKYHDLEEVNKKLSAVRGAAKLVIDLWERQDGHISCPLLSGERSLEALKTALNKLEG